MAKKKTRLEAALSAAGSALTEAAEGAAGSVLGRAGKKVGSAVLKSSGLIGNIVDKSLESVIKKKKKKTEAERIREQSGAAVSADELRRLQTKPLE
jgi:predicted hydrocarbon binding protein